MVWQLWIAEVLETVKVADNLKQEMKIRCDGIVLRDCQVMVRLI